MLEEWAWDADDPAHLRASTPTASRSRATWSRGCARRRSSARAYFVRTQIFYAAVSYLLHRDRPDDITAAVRELQAALRPASTTSTARTSRRRSGTSRLHVGATTRTCGAWSSRRTCSRPSTRTTCSARRSPAATATAILAPGGSKDAAELVADFLGRAVRLRRVRRMARPRPGTPAAARRTLTDRRSRDRAEPERPVDLVRRRVGEVGVQHRDGARRRGCRSAARGGDGRAVAVAAVLAAVCTPARSARHRPRAAGAPPSSTGTFLPGRATARCAPVDHRPGPGRRASKSSAGSWPYVSTRERRDP